MLVMGYHAGLVDVFGCLVSCALADADADSHIHIYLFHFIFILLTTWIVCVCGNLYSSGDRMIEWECGWHHVRMSGHIIAHKYVYYHVNYISFSFFFVCAQGHVRLRTRLLSNTPSQYTVIMNSEYQRNILTDQNVVPLTFEMMGLWLLFTRTNTLHYHVTATVT